MDIAGFLAAVEDIFDTDEQGVLRAPKDPSHAQLTADVAGMTTTNEVAVLNTAAKLLPAGECYVEVGSFKGRSICGATQGVSGGPFYVLENFLEFGMLGDEARAELMTNLARHCADKDVRLIDGDAFATLTRPGMIAEPVGVYFYDGEHTRLSHYLALGVIEPLLADEALILVDDATWPMVQRAHERYMSEHPGWQVIKRWDARTNDDPDWANGLHALSFRRPAGAKRELSPNVRLAMAAQRSVVGPMRKLAWTTLHKAPWLVPLAKKIEPKKHHAIS